jgi:hypothetical protein
MLRRVGLLVALTAFFTVGCSIDRVEWESSGFPVEEVRHALEEEHHAESPSVECIQREVLGAEWECRAHAAEAEFHCHVKAGPRDVIHEIECEQGHEEETAQHGEEEPEHEEEAPEHEEEEAPADEEEHPEDH